MQKILTVAALAIFGTLALRAQDTGGRSLAVTAGTNQSRFSEDGNDEADCLMALFFGADVVLCDHGPLRFSTGMNYTGTGSSYKSGEEGGEGGSYSFENKETLTYLNIPVEARYEFGAGKIKPFVRGGGTFGLLLTAKSKTTTNFNGQKNEDETDLKNRKKSTNLGLNLGGGVSFPLGKFRGVASVRYMLGLTNIVKDDNAPAAKTREVSVAVGLLIPVF